MSDEGKDELRARFQDRAERRTRDSGDADNPTDSDNTGNTENADAVSEADTTQSTSEASDSDTTRSRKQMPMYLTEAQREDFNALYERLDARKKLAGEGGLEKHKDFMEGLVQFALDHEDDLAEQLGVPMED